MPLTRPELSEDILRASLASHRPRGTTPGYLQLVRDSLSMRAMPVRIRRRGPGQTEARQEAGLRVPQDSLSTADCIAAPSARRHSRTLVQAAGGAAVRLR